MSGTIKDRGAIYSDAVRSLQQALNRVAKSYPNVPRLAENGVYCAQTEQAVRQAQQLLGLADTGVTDFTTWNGIMALAQSLKRESACFVRPDFFPPGTVCAQGDAGDRVAVMQIMLRRLSQRYKNVPQCQPSGRMDGATAAAVSVLQQVFGLPETGQPDCVFFSLLCSLYNSAAV